MRTVLDVVSSFSSLQNLEIHWVNDDFFNVYPFPPDYVFSPRLRAVAIAGYIQDFFLQILSLNTIPLFSSITWGQFSAWPGEDTPIGKYFSRAGAALHHLRLHPGFKQPFNFASEPSPLRHCTGLRSLYIGHIGTSRHNNPHAILLAALPYFRAPELASITLSAPYGTVSPAVDTVPAADAAVVCPADTDTWRAIDKALAGDMFAGLEALNVMCGGNAWLKRHLAGCMPLCAARGILVVDWRNGQRWVTQMGA
ncbi:hypothetical protein DFH09DRAFT_1072165 [Mycena vulgaris]|nr:hypothetical protein DFH09DRAFT_1072165 [Mycena vulgaris]